MLCLLILLIQQSFRSDAGEVKRKLKLLVQAVRLLVEYSTVYREGKFWKQMVWQHLPRYL